MILSFAIRSGGKALLLCLLLLLVTQAATGQLHCINYTSQDGLPSDNMTRAIEDQLGYMWFGSVDGLCRFDGQQFIVYSNLGSGDVPGAISVKALEVDAQNQIWVATERRGIYKYNPQKKSWKRFAPDLEGERFIPASEVSFLLSADDGKMWYGGQSGGLGYIDETNGQLKNYDLSDLPSNGKWVNVAFTMLADPKRKDIFYIGAQGLLFSFDAKSEEFKLLEDKSNFTFGKGWSIQAQTMVWGPNDNIWFGSYAGGIFEYNFEQKKYIPHNPPAFAEQIIWQANVFSKDVKSIWASYRNHGIAKYDFVTQEWTRYQPEPFNRNGLLQGTYSSIYQNKNGETWVMSSGGLSLIVPEYQAFDYFETDVAGMNFFLDIHYNESAEKYLLAFGGEDGPFKIYDQNFKLKKKAYFNKNKFQTVYDIVGDEGDIYIVSSGIFKYDWASNSFEDFQNKEGLPAGAIAELFIDQNYYWLLYRNHQLIKFDRVSKKKQIYSFESHRGAESTKISYNDFQKIKDKYWIAAESEIIIFDEATFLPTHFYFDGTEFIKLDDPAEGAPRISNIEQVLPIADACAWVLTQSEGIYKVCYQQGHLEIKERRTQKDAPALQMAMNMVKGEQEDYWLATNVGLLYSADANLSELRLIGKREGLRNTRLNQGVSRLGPYLYLGMPKGFARLDTRKILQQRPAQPCTIEMARVTNKDFSTLDDFEFSHLENDFLVKVSTPNYFEASSVSYAHRLVNYNSEWKYGSGDEQSFSYDQLPPGNYQFEVKARSKNLSWSKVQSLAFTILPPFWATWWFRALCALLGVLTIFLIYKYRIRRAVREEQLKTKMAELENQALRAQMNPHFIFNSLNSIKSLILMEKKSSAINYLTQFSKLVREILALSKETLIPLQKELELLSLYLEMESLRFQDKFKYAINIDSQVNIYAVKIPPLLIQPYAENAIWHGLLHKEGKAVLTINIGEVAGELTISIVDNGIGREASDRMKSSAPGYKKKYHGMKINESRIDLMSDPSSVAVEDLYEASGAASGTRIVIKLPNHE